MEELVVGALVGTAFVAGVLLWHLRVDPDGTLAWWSVQDPSREAWLRHHPGAVRALRLAAGGIVFLLGFLAGLALTFLQATAGG